MIFKKSAKFHLVYVTDNFRLHELECPCNRCDKEMQVIDLELVLKLQRTRDANKLPIKVNSGYRCAARNIEVGGAPDSSHRKGLAVDIYSIGRSAFDLARIALIYGGFRNFGLGKNYVHLDNRPGELRTWVYPGAELDNFEFREAMEQELEELKK